VWFKKWKKIINQNLEIVFVLRLMQKLFLFHIVEKQELRQAGANFACDGVVAVFSLKSS